MSPSADSNSCMKISVASSITDIPDDDCVTEFGANVVVVLRGTLGRLDVLDGATVVMRFWKVLPYTLISQSKL